MIVVFQNTPGTKRPIEFILTGSSPLPGEIPPGYTWVHATVASAADIINELDEIVAKTPVPYDLDGNVLSNLPRCTATVDAQTVLVDDEVLNVAPDYPGTYKVLLKSPVYLDTTVSFIMP